MVAKKTNVKAVAKKTNVKKEVKKECQCGNPNCHCGDNCHCSQCHCGCFKKVALLEVITVIVTVLITLAIVSGGHRGRRGDCRGPEFNRRDNNAPCPFAKDNKGWDRKDGCPCARDGKDNKRGMRDSKKDARNTYSKTETTETK